MSRASEIKSVLAVVFLVCFFCSFEPPMILAQTCHDRDGDGFLAGAGCLQATDCNDDDQQINPARPDVCNGIDDNCDGQIDENCVRICAQPQLFKIPKKLSIPGNANVTSALIGQFPAGPALAIESGNNPGEVYLDILEYAQGFDTGRTPWTSANLLGDAGLSHPYELGQQIAGGGERMLIAYQDRSAHEQTKAKTYVRVVDRLGRPVHPLPIPLLPTLPGAESPWLYHSAAWDGESFALFWSASPRTNELLMTRIGYDGTLPTNPTKVVTNSIDGKGSMLQDISVVWTGSAFVAAIDTGISELVVLKVGRDGTVLHSEILSGKYSGLPRLIRAGDRLALGYSFNEDGKENLRVGFLDLDGNLLSQGWTTIHHEYISQSLNLQLAWTGSVVGVLFSGTCEIGPGYPIRWRFWQVRPDGSVVPPGMVVLVEGGKTYEGTSLIWTGAEFQMIGTFKDNTANWERIICSCADNDQDGFDTCNGRDNDDDNPKVHPGAPEICRGGADEDGDGLVDCSDPDCPAAAGPGEVQGLLWNGDLLRWEPAPGAQVYDLARGLWSDFARRGDFALGDCLARSQTGTVWNDDGRKPPIGDFLWYLVRAEGAPCARGSWGPPAHPRVVKACH